MKRFHVHVGVENLEASIAFYTGLFAAAPTIAKPDYAKWMLNDPRVNFAISQKCGAVKGIEHIGMQVEDEEELAEIYGRLKSTNGPVQEEGATNCCYASSEKNWITDPDGVIWETFLTTGEATDYGHKIDIPQLVSSGVSETACCAPSIKTAGL